MPPSLFSILTTIGTASAIYTATIFSILRIPWLENHAVYMHRLFLIGKKNLHVPEQFGFAARQVTPFFIKTPGSVNLHAWHVLPIGVYFKHATQLLGQAPTTNIQDTLNFALLREDPDARLVIHTHGSSGCLAAYCRPETYRALSALSPSKVHVLAFDYRGFGLSSGTPSEEGLRIDVQSVFDWATNIACIPPERIVVFGQSMGVGVAISLVRELAMRDVEVGGMVIAGGFADVRSMLCEYRIFGWRPLGVLAVWPRVKDYLTRQMRNQWKNRNGLVDIVQHSPAYHIEIFHAQDDPIVSWEMSNKFFEAAVKAASGEELDEEKFEKGKKERMVDLGEGGWAVEWEMEKGVIRQEVVRYGEHDKIMAQPQIGVAVMRAFQSRDPTFGGEQ